MRYLFTCARKYIIESHASGPSLWKSLEKSIEFIITHPNGWEGLQQQNIRQAAVIAEFIPSGDEHSHRIHLLTEGEASLHFCVARVLTSETLSHLAIVQSDNVEEEEEDEEDEDEDEDEEEDEDSDHQGIIIIDAGGGTIDLSAYSVKLSPPKEFKEIAPAECNMF